LTPQKVNERREKGLVSIVIGSKGRGINAARENYYTLTGRGRRSIIGAITRPRNRRYYANNIHLQPRSVPPNIRPYRYPYAQKSEIECIVQEMLEVGIIQPSQSDLS
jgi:hypothetical protein